MTSKPVLSDAEFEALAKGAGGGFQQVDTSWPDAHDFDTVPVLTGEVVEVEAVTITDRHTRRASIKTDKGVVSLWESASLTKLFDKMKPGVVVLVKFTGMKALPGGREQRQFTVGIKAARG